jgi:hypothetical protein
MDKNIDKILIILTIFGLIIVIGIYTFYIIKSLDCLKLLESNIFKMLISF